MHAKGSKKPVWACECNNHNDDKKYEVGCTVFAIIHWNEEVFMATRGPADSGFT